MRCMLLALVYVLYNLHCIVVTTELLHIPKCCWLNLVNAAMSNFPTVSITVLNAPMLYYFEVMLF